jgi:hypothetical protein
VYSGDDLPSADGVDVGVTSRLNTYEGEDEPEQKGQNGFANSLDRKSIIWVKHGNRNTYNAKLRAHERTRDDQRYDNAGNPSPGLDTVLEGCRINVLLRNVVRIVNKDTLECGSD